MTVRIDRDDCGKLDDVVISDVETFHMEWMDDRGVFIACYRADGTEFKFWLKSKGHIHCVMTEDEKGEPL